MRLPGPVWLNWQSGCVYYRFNIVEDSDVGGVQYFFRYYS